MDNKIKMDFRDPGLNDFPGDKGIGKVIDDEIKKTLPKLEGMTPSERFLTIIVCGIGDRIDRLINMVKKLDEKIR